MAERTAIETATRVPFVGRADEIERVERSLAEIGVVVVTGLPGVGKSRLIDQVASRWTSGRVLPQTRANRAAAGDLVLAGRGAGFERLVARGIRVLVESRTFLEKHALQADQVVLGALDPEAARQLFAETLTMLGVQPGSFGRSGSKAITAGRPAGAVACAPSVHPAAVLAAARDVAAGRRSDAAALSRLALPEISHEAMELLTLAAAVSVPLPRSAFDELSGAVDEAISNHALLASPDGLQLSALLRPGLIGCQLASSRLAPVLVRLAASSAAAAGEALHHLASAGQLLDLASLLESRGEQLLEAGLARRVGTALSACREAGIDSPGLRVLLGEQLLRAGSPGKAAAVLRELESGPRVSLALAQAEYALGEKSCALARLAPLLEDAGTRRSALRLRAEFHYRDSAYDQALRDFEESDCLAGVANSSFRLGRTLSAAELHVQRRARLDPEREPAAFAALLVNESVVSCARGDLETAVARCREAVALGASALPLANLVQLEMLRGRFAESRAAFDSLAALGSSVPAGIRAAAHKGLSFAETRSGRPLQGLTLARRALVLAREGRDAVEEAEAHMALGEALLATGDRQAARDAAEQGLNLARRLSSPIGQADALLLLGTIEDDGTVLANQAWEIASSAGYLLGCVEATLAGAARALAACDVSAAYAQATGIIPSARTLPVQLERARELAAEAALGLGDFASVRRLAKDSPRSARLAALAARACVLTGDLDGASGTLWALVAGGQLSDALSRIDSTPLDPGEEALLRAAIAFRGRRGEDALRILERAARTRPRGVLGAAVSLALVTVHRSLGHHSEARRLTSDCPLPAGLELQPWLTALGLESHPTYSPTIDPPQVVCESRGPDTLQIDLSGERIRVGAREWLDLSHRRQPLQLLALLASEHGRLVPKQRIYEAIWEREYNPEIHYNTIHVLVRRLRRELEAAGARRDAILTDLPSGSYALAASLACERVGGGAAQERSKADSELRARPA